MFLISNFMLSSPLLFLCIYQLFFVLISHEMLIGNSFSDNSLGRMINRKSAILIFILYHLHVDSNCSTFVVFCLESHLVTLIHFIICKRAMEKILITSRFNKSKTLISIIVFHDALH